jgi:hypothetical protein
MHTCKDNMSVLLFCLIGFSARVCRSRSHWVQASKAWPTILLLLQFMLRIACELHLVLQLQSYCVSQRYKTREFPSWYASCVAVWKKLHLQFERKAITFALIWIANLFINCPSVSPSHNCSHGAYTCDFLRWCASHAWFGQKKKLCSLKTKLCTISSFSLIAYTLPV